MRWKFVALAVTALGGAVLAQEASREAALGNLEAVLAELAESFNDGLEAVDPAARERLTPTLAAWIAAFRDAAIERGAEGIPAEIREGLSGFVPANVLGSVRWRIDREASVAGQSLFQLGAVRAVTLDNVILFADADEAADATLWAHELYHVMQYRQWGIEGFVARYLADHRAVEHEAGEFRWRWMKATGRAPAA